MNGSTADTMVGAKQQTVVKGRTRRRRLLALIFPCAHWVREVNRQSLLRDALAALSSAIFALPQCVAFALIAGMPPEFGLYAAIVAPIVTGVFGCSLHNVSGPTVATSIVILSIISAYAVPQSPQFITLVLSLTFLAGIIQLLFGVFRMGALVDFVSHTVVAGFSLGAAILIMTSQLPKMLGIEMERQGNFFTTLQEIWNRLGEMNSNYFAVSAITFASAVILKRIAPKIPFLLVAMIVGAISALIFTGVEMVGAIPKGIPPLMSPNMDFHTLRNLFPGAVAIAMLGLIQTVSISKNVAIKSGQRIDSNQEFVGQGLTNLACSFTNGFFSSSSFTRTGVNFDAGAITPMSSVIASALIIAFVYVAGDLTMYLPTASMGAIIFLVGWGLVDVKLMRKLFKTDRSEVFIFGITCLATLVLSLEFAIYIGVLTSLLIYLQQTSHPKVLTMISDPNDPYGLVRIKSSDKQTEDDVLKIIRIDGSIYFGSVSHIEKELHDLMNIPSPQNSILIIGDGMTLIDLAGAEMLLRLKSRLNSVNGELYLSDLKPDARTFLFKSPYWKLLNGRDHVFNYAHEAVNHNQRRREGMLTNTSENT